MGEPTKNGNVQSLQRALSLMNCLAQSPSGLGLKDIAAEAGLPPSTAHRLLSTLLDQGFVHIQPGGQKWTIGVQAFSVGQSFLAGRDLIQIARAPMVKLMEETQETVKMGFLSGDHVVILTQAECSQPMRAFAEPGASLPLHCTSMGKALLAAHGKGAAHDLLVAQSITAQTAKTILKFDPLWSDIEATWARGYAVQDEEYLIGLRGAAACIYDENGKPAAALSVNGPSVRIPSDRLDQLGELVADVCQEITASYGGKIPEVVAA